MTKKHGKKQEKMTATDDRTIQGEGQSAACTENSKAEPQVQDAAGAQTASVKHACGCYEQGEAQRKDGSAGEAERIATLEAQCKDLQDQYLRKAADFDNYRKRMIKEKQEAIDYANTNLLSDLLQILDDFDRAIEAGGGDGNAAAFMQGVTMIRSSLLGLLESKYGLQYYEVKGTPFNPEIHEAVATNPSAEVKDPTVGAELQKGYKLKDRILRSAKVMVLMPAQAETKDN